RQPGQVDSAPSPCSRLPFFTELRLLVTPLSPSRVRDWERGRSMASKSKAFQIAPIKPGRGFFMRATLSSQHPATRFAILHSFPPSPAPLTHHVRTLRLRS